MRVFLFLLLTITYVQSFGQNQTQIDLDLGIPDSLTFRKEFRIYKTEGHTNWTGVLRLYQKKNEKWEAEYYDHYGKVENVTELKTEKRQLKPKNLDSFG